MTHWNEQRDKIEGGNPWCPPSQYFYRLDTPI